ncbi:MAG: hypothetical protein KF706_02490 [Chitinophagales bacterium]|nr:hypothetical protein [Chitinophagales bacterium]
MKITQEQKERGLLSGIIIVMIFFKNAISINIDFKDLISNSELILNTCISIVLVLIVAYWVYKEVLWQVNAFKSRHRDDLDMIRFINEYRREYIKVVSIESAISGIYSNPIFFDNSSIKMKEKGAGVFNMNSAIKYHDNYIETERENAVQFFLKKRNKQLSEAQEIVMRYYDMDKEL